MLRPDGWVITRQWQDLPGGTSAECAFTSMTSPSHKTTATIHPIKSDGLARTGQPGLSRPALVKWVLGGVALAIVLAGSWYATHQDEGTNRPIAPLAVSVRVAPASRGDMPVVERTIGTVVSNAMVQVTAMVPGPLERAYFREGQIVKKGDLLFQIDSRSFQAALVQAKGQLTKDQALLAGAERDLDRDQRLMSAGAGTRQILEDQEATVASDKGTVQADQGNVDTAAINLGYTQIRSPIDGKTGPILIQPGNVIAVTGTSTTTTPLVTITQIRPIKVSFFLPQADLPRIQARQRSHGLVALIDMRNEGGVHFTAPVTFTGNAVNNQTGTIELRVTLDNKDGVLVPGQVVNVSVALDDIPNAIIVPHEAVNDGPTGHYVFVVRNGSAELCPVKVLFDDSHHVAVRGALKPGDQVVVDGQLRVVPGAPVTIDTTQDDSDAASGTAISAVPQ
jgi:multidrug efflux system membrane fusion protein